MSTANLFSFSYLKCRAWMNERTIYFFFSIFGVSFFFFFLNLKMCFFLSSLVYVAQHALCSSDPDFSFASRGQNLGTIQVSWIGSSVSARLVLSVSLVPRRLLRRRLTAPTPVSEQGGTNPQCPFGFGEWGGCGEDECQYWK